MNRHYLAFLASVGFVVSMPCAAQTGEQAEKSLVPQGMIADREALSPEDYVEIRQLYARYAASLDFGDGGARETTFTPEGYYANLPSGHKPVPVKELVRRTNAAGNEGDRHMVTNVIITPTEEGADGFAYQLYVNRHGKVHTGFYLDKLIRTADGWRFGGRHGWYDIDPASPYRAKPEADARPPAATEP